MADQLLRAENMTVGYGGVPLIRDIALSVSGGEILTLVGPNGSGKSTILKSLIRELALLGGTVYLDGSGNSYGGMGGFTTKVTDTQTKTADGEEEIFSFTAEVTMESVERVTELEVRWYGEEELLDRRTLTMEEVGEGLSLERPQGAVWALVTQRDRTGDTERSVYTLGTEAGASHHLVQLDERGMGRVVYLNLD